MAIEGTSDFARATIGTYRTGTTETSSVLATGTNSLASGAVEDGDFFNISNKKIVTGIDIQTAFSNNARALLEITNYAAFSPTAVAATATFTFGTFPGSGVIGSGGAAIDGTTITLIDSDGTTVVFEIDDATTGDGDGVTGSNIPIINRTLAGADVAGTMGPGNLATSLAYWINQQGTLDIVATNPSGGQVTLTQGTQATTGNTTITLSNATNWNAACSVNVPSAFTGGFVGGAHSVALTATDKTVITASASASTTTTTDTVSPTFQVTTDNNTTATNLATCLNANSRFTATADDAIVTVTQVTSGSEGNTAITLTDPVTAGMTAIAFGATAALSGGGILLELEGSANGTSWAVLSTLDSDFASQTTGVHRYVVDLSKASIPYFRLHLNSGGRNIGTTGTAQFYFSERTTSIT